LLSRRGWRNQHKGGGKDERGGPQRRRAWFFFFWGWGVFKKGQDFHQDEVAIEAAKRGKNCLEIKRSMYWEMNRGPMAKLAPRSLEKRKRNQPAVSFFELKRKKRRKETARVEKTAADVRWGPAQSKAKKNQDSTRRRFLFVYAYLSEERGVTSFHEEWRGPGRRRTGEIGHTARPE